MAINPSTNVTMTGRVTTPNADYTYGSSQDETAPGAGDGTPYFKARADDLFGLQQAILKACGIVPSGNADTQLVSEYLQGIVEIASGRAFNYDDSGIADAYVLDVQTNQQGPRSYFDGMIAEFIVGNTNTGASTVNVNSLGVVNIVGTSGGGELAAGQRIKIRYRTSSGDFDIPAIVGKLAQYVYTETGAVASNAATMDWDDSIPQYDEGFEYMSQAITPINAASTLIIEVLFNFTNTSGNVQMLSLFQDGVGTDAAIAATHTRFNTAGIAGQMVLTHAIVAGTTSATTFNLRSGADSGTTTFNGQTGSRKLGGVMASSIRITEILP